MKGMFRVGLIAMMAVPFAAADDPSTAALILRGEILSDSDAAVMERSLETEPDDRAARIELLGYWNWLSRADTTAVISARARHILWLIRESPRDDVFGTNAASVSLPALGRRRPKTSPSGSTNRNCPNQGGGCCPRRFESPAMSWPAWRSISP
jgi:hypothetical protein